MSTVTLRVVIDHVEEDGCTDTWPDESDFFGSATIAGQTFDFAEITDEDEISPGWKAEMVLDVDQMSSASVAIELLDEDSALYLGDDVCDITPNSGTILDLTVGLDPFAPCPVTGDVNGACGSTILASGNGGGDGDAELRFHVDVEAPSAIPRLAVRCTHTPLWPQPGDDVTITVESLDGDLQVDDGADHKKIAEHLEIWVDDPNGPVFDVANKATDSFTVNNVAAGDVVYGCVVKLAGKQLFSNWRQVAVGPPTVGSAIPVGFIGERKDRVDIVFIADMDSYTSAGDANFLAAAADKIKNAYFGQDYFLANQQRFNFWIADQMGDADRVPAPTPNDPANTNCVLGTPGNWFSDYSWRDSGAILHTDFFRDCANNGTFSAWTAGQNGIVLHETGHSPFGLADECCCDGGYFENHPDPNLWDSFLECIADAPSLGRTAADCRVLTDDADQSWFLSEPEPNDLMNVDMRPPQAADIRRMNGILDKCKAGNC